MLSAYLETTGRDPACPADAAEPQSDPATGDDDGEGQSWGPPPVDSADSDEWESLVDSLANRILWEDGDYEMGGDLLDLDPPEGRARMRMLGIADDSSRGAPPTEARTWPPARTQAARRGPPRAARRPSRSSPGRGPSSETRAGYEVIEWLRWRRAHQAYARRCDYRKRGAEPPDQLQL